MRVMNSCKARKNLLIFIFIFFGTIQTCISQTNTIREIVDADVLNFDRDSIYKKIIYKNYPNTDTLRFIALNYNDPQVRIDAIKKINNDSILFQVYSKYRIDLDSIELLDSNIRPYSKEKELEGYLKISAKEINNQMLLKEIILKEKTSSLAFDLIEKKNFSDQELLKEIYIKNQLYWPSMIPIKDIIEGDTVEVNLIILFPYDEPIEEIETDENGKEFISLTIGSTRDDMKEEIPHEKIDGGFKGTAENKIAIMNKLCDERIIEELSLSSDNNYFLFFTIFKEKDSRYYNHNQVLTNQYYFFSSYKSTNNKYIKKKLVDRYIMDDNLLESLKSEETDSLLLASITDKLKTSMQKRLEIKNSLYKKEFAPAILDQFWFDNSIFSWVIENSHDTAIRAFALTKIINDYVLLKIVKDSRNPEILRILAASKIKSEDLLKELFKEDFSFKITSQIIKKINDEGFLADSYDYKMDPQIKRSLVDKIKNNDLILSILNKEKYLNESDYIFSKIKDLDLMKKLALKYDSKYIVEKIDDIELLKKLYYRCKNYYTLEKIIYKLKDDKEFLKEVVEEKSDYSVLSSILRKLSDSDIYEVFTKSKDSNFKWKMLLTLGNETPRAVIDKALFDPVDSIRYQGYGTARYKYYSIYRDKSKDELKEIGTKYPDSLFIHTVDYAFSEKATSGEIKEIIDSIKEQFNSDRMFSNLFFYQYKLGMELKENTDYNYEDDKYINDLLKIIDLYYSDQKRFYYNDYITYKFAQSEENDSLRSEYIRRIKKDYFIHKLLTLEKNTEIRAMIISRLDSLSKPEDLLKKASSENERKAIYAKLDSLNLLNKFLKKEKNSLAKKYLNNRIHLFMNDTSYFREYLEDWNKYFSKKKPNYDLNEQNIVELYTAFIESYNSRYNAKPENDRKYLFIQSELEYHISEYFYGDYNSNKYNENEIKKAKVFPFLDNGFKYLYDAGEYSYLGLNKLCEDNIYNVFSYYSSKNVHKYDSSRTIYSYPKIYRIELNNEGNTAKISYDSEDGFTDCIFIKRSGKWRDYKKGSSFRSSVGLHIEYKGKYIDIIKTFFDIE